MVYVWGDVYQYLSSFISVYFLNFFKIKFKISIILSLKQDLVPREEQTWEIDFINTEQLNG